MPRIQELITRDPSPVDVFNHKVRDDVATLLDTLGIEPAPSSFPQPRSTNNNISLTAGSHGGASLTKEDTRVRAIPAGVEMTRTLSVSRDCEVDGVHFTSVSTAVATASLVSLEGTSVSVFRGCVFEKSSVDEPTYISVATGAKAIFVGCVFRGNTGAAGDLFSHAGPAGNVQLLGCYNKTTHAYGANTTQTACL